MPSDQLLSDRVQSDRVSSDRVQGDRVSSGHPALVGFGVWLAGRFVPLAQRRRVHSEVERFLSWEGTALPDDTVPYDPAMQRPAVWCYLLQRQREGCADAEALKLWGALELFLSYLDSQQPA